VHEKLRKPLAESFDARAAGDGFRSSRTTCCRPPYGLRCRVPAQPIMATRPMRSV